MKNLFYIMVLSVMLGGCYSDTVDSFSTFTFQFPVNLNSTYLDRDVPDISKDFSNLYKYDEYYENRDKINKAYAIQFNYWMDSLVLPGDIPFDPEVHDTEFEFVRYKLIFARPKDGNIFSEDSSNFEPDPTIEAFELGTFYNVKVKDFYRNPSHILDVPDVVSAKISEYLRTKPFFFVVSEYSKLKGQGTDPYEFPFMKTRFDIIIRFEVKL